MRIAILVWGSLFWDPRNLEIAEEWYFDGPILPIEFARISGDNRLTLVIKPTFDDVTTLYAVSSHNELQLARENLRVREGTDNINNIGYLDFINNTQNIRQANLFMINILRNWNETRGYDAIIWSDFAPRFTDVTGLVFTLNNVTTFLTNLPEVERENALEYIERAPAQINTRFRNSIEQHFHR